MEKEILVFATCVLLGLLVGIGIKIIEFVNNLRDNIHSRISPEKLREEFDRRFELFVNLIWGDQPKLAQREARHLQKFLGS